MSNIHPGCRYTEPRRSHGAPCLTLARERARVLTESPQPTPTAIHHDEGEDSVDTNTVSITGNLVDDPEIRFTKDDTPVAEFRLAHNRRHRKTDGTWDDGRRVYITVRAWRRLAQDVAAGLSKGDAVRVDGTLTHDEWTDDNGNRRETISIDARDVRTPLTASVSRDALKP